MMLNWSWSGKFLAINEAPFIIGSLSLRVFTMSVVLRRPRRGDVALPRLPHETRRLSCGRVDGVEAAWRHKRRHRRDPGTFKFHEDAAPVPRNDGRLPPEGRRLRRPRQSPFEA